MSTHFNANQYEEAFVPHRLRNWEVPKGYRETLPGYALQHPRTYQGCTQVIGTDRGHLMDSVARSNKNPWGDFVGTWDLPKQIPGQRYNVPTARSANAQQRLTLSAREAARVLNGADKNVKRQALQSDDVNVPVPTTERRSGAEGPASNMIPTSTPPGLMYDTYYTAPCACCPAGVEFSPPAGPTPSPPCPEDFYGALKSPNGLPATPPEVQKIPTPGMGECVTPPAHPPMVKVATPVMEPIRTPQLPPIRTPELKADSPKFMSPKALSPAMMNGSPKPPTPHVVRELEVELAE